MNGDLTAHGKPLNGRKDWPDDRSSQDAGRSFRTKRDFVRRHQPKHAMPNRRKTGYSLTWFVNAQISIQPQRDRERRHRSHPANNFFLRNRRRA